MKLLASDSEKNILSYSRLLYFNAHFWHHLCYSKIKG